MAVITISRESGSGGKEIAALLSEKLNYQILTKAVMMDLVGRLESGALAQSSSEGTSITEGLLDWMSMPTAQREKSTLSSIDFEKPLTIRQVRDLVLAAYQHDNMIIIGRGSQVILADKPNVLHVRVIAPIEKRVAARAAREGLSLKEAQKKLAEADKAHVDFVKNFFDVDNRDPLLYDLVINTGKISIAAGAELILLALDKLP